MSSLTINKIRQRTFHSLSPYTAQQCGDGCSVELLKQFCACAWMPSDAQLVRLANYYQISKD